MRALHIWGQAPLLLLTIALGMAWADEMEVYRNLVLRPVFYKNLVFVSKTKSLVTSSEKSGIKAKRKVGELPIETSGFAIRLWSVENGKLEDAMEFSRGEEPRKIDVSPDGELMAVAFRIFPTKGERSGYASIACYSLSEKEWLWRNDWRSKYMAREVKFSPDGLKVIVIGYENILLYDAKTGKKLEIIEEPLKDYPIIGMSIRGSVLSPSGRYFVVWQEKPLPGHHLLGRLIANKWVTVWDLQTRKQIARWKKPEYENICAVFTKDENNILFGSEEGHIRMWSVEKQEMIREWSVGETTVDYLKFSNDYRYLAIFGVGKKFHIIIFDYLEENEVHHFSGFDCVHGEGESFPMTFFNTSKFFTFAESHRLCVYDTQTWQEKWCVASSLEGKD